MTSTIVHECLGALRPLIIPRRPPHALRSALPTLLLTALLAVGCGGEAEEGVRGGADTESHGSAGTEKRRDMGSYDFEGLAAFRASKDKGFGGVDSPIPDAVRGEFTGLAYYPADSSLSIPVRLERLPSPEEFEMMTSTGKPRPMIRYGTFSFTVNGTPCRLTAYKSAAGPTHLFVPFRDSTSGNETYGAGRYLDLDEHDGDGPYILDFNLAYNPYCAYNEDYSCPLVPAENVLRVAIRAGEKTPPSKGH